MQYLAGESTKEEEEAEREEKSEGRYEQHQVDCVAGEVISHKLEGSRRIRGSERTN